MAITGISYGARTMASVDISFCRALLSRIVPDLKDKGVRVNNDAWVYHFHGDHWEFHGPNDFYWHGSAGNAYEARYKGWSAWLANPKGKH